MAKTPKAVALGNALRQARLNKGLNLRAFAAQLSKDPGMISRWENGERTPKPEQVAQILTELGVRGQEYDDILTLVYGAAEPTWMATTLPQQRAQMAAYLEYEQAARSIVEVAPLIIPGLLQTTDYIRAIMTAGTVPKQDISTRVSVRLGRRDVITRPRPAKLVVLLGQAALYQSVCGTAAMAAQLLHLVEMARLPNIDLRVVPFGKGWHPGLEGAFTLLEQDDHSAAVFLETRRCTLWLHQQDDLNAYRHAVDMVTREAMGAADSARFIAEVAQRMETRSDVPEGVAQVES